MIVARSFARIHETNLKVGPVITIQRLDQAHRLQKQGILPLWFADKSDYSRVGAGDGLETVGLEMLLKGDPTAQIKLRVTPREGDAFEILTRHTMSKDQIKWLLAGSALNQIKADSKSRSV